MDKLIWAEFHENLAEAAPASEQAFQNLFGEEKGEGVEVIPKKGIRPRKIASRLEGVAPQTEGFPSMAC